MHARGANIREISEDYLRTVEELDRVRAELDHRRKLDRPLLQSEREAMLTMIAAMAVKGYAYSPGSDAVADITSDITKVGLTLDVKTARKWVPLAIRMAKDRVECASLPPAPPVTTATFDESTILSAAR